MKEAPMIVDALEEDYGSPYEVDPAEVLSTFQLAMALCAVVVLS